MSMSIIPLYSDYFLYENEYQEFHGQIGIFLSLRVHQGSQAEICLLRLLNLRRGELFDPGHPRLKKLNLIITGKIVDHGLRWRILAPAFPPRATDHLVFPQGGLVSDIIRSN